MSRDMAATKLTFAVGDIHGRYDCLSAALAWIADRAGEDETTVVFLGDYIDRGPDSCLVVNRLLAGQEGRLKFLCLRGNHEEMLLDSVRRITALDHWLANGGHATLASYGGPVWDRHLAWMADLPLFHEDEYRFFVHAGLNPRHPRDKQTEYDMLWIRERFLLSEHDFGKHVVHGHTPDFEGPELLPWRTNLDIGAFRSGRLCIGVFDADQPGGPVETAIVTA